MALWPFAPQALLPSHKPFSLTPALALHPRQLRLRLSFLQAAAAARALDIACRRLEGRREARLARSALAILRAAPADRRRRGGQRQRAARFAERMQLAVAGDAFSGGGRPLLLDSVSRTESSCELG